MENKKDGKQYSPTALKLQYEMKVIADAIQVQQVKEREGNLENIWYKTKDARAEISELTKSYNRLANKYRKLRMEEDNLRLL